MVRAGGTTSFDDSPRSFACARRASLWMTKVARNPLPVVIQKRAKRSRRISGQTTHRWLLSAFECARGAAASLIVRVGGPTSFDDSLRSFACAHRASLWMTTGKSGPAHTLKPLPLNTRAQCLPVCFHQQSVCHSRTIVIIGLTMAKALKANRVHRRRATTTVIFFASLLLYCGPSWAQATPNWCSDVPASPPPPTFEHHPGEWAEARQLCMSARKGDRRCRYICADAQDRWRLQKSGRLNEPNTFPTPTDQPQGPFPLPGGGSGYILPEQPAPTPGGQRSDALHRRYQPTPTGVRGYRKLLPRRSGKMSQDSGRKFSESVHLI